MITTEAPLTTLVHEPIRGEGGVSAYPGNWGGSFVERILNWIKPRRVFDPAVGGGTSIDVCERLGIEIEGYDLNPHPLKGVGGFDFRRDEPRRAPDLILFHPPYWNMYRYSGDVWGNRPDPRDVSSIESWGEFVRQMNTAVMHLWATLRIRGQMAVLVGDVARKGQLYAMQHEIVWPGTPVRTLIKEQFAARSFRTNYAGHFIPIVHEYLLLFQKTSAYRVRVTYAVTRDLDLRKRPLTWVQAVQAAVEALGGRATTQDVYAEMARSFPERVDKSRFWKEKVRQCLQGERFNRVGPALYALA